MPPSTRNSAPVTYDDVVRHQEQRRAARSPLPRRTAHGNVHEPALLLLVRVEELHQQLGLERPRTERVDADVLARVHDRQLARQRQHRALAGRVGHLRRRRAEQRHKGRGVDDRAAASAAQGGDAVLAPEEHALRIDVHRHIPHRLVGRHRIVVLAVHDAGVVEQDVQRPELALGRARSCARSPRHARHRPGRQSRGRPRPGSRSAVCRADESIDIDGDDRRAFDAAQQRRLTSDPAAGAGNQRHLSLEPCAVAQMRSKYRRRSQSVTAVE